MIIQVGQRNFIMRSGKTIDSMPDISKATIIGIRIEAWKFLLTGASDSALSINKAPKMSIRKPNAQGLLTAYALIT